MTLEEGRELSKSVCISLYHVGRNCFSLGDRILWLKIPVYIFAEFTLKRGILQKCTQGSKGLICILLDCLLKQFEADTVCDRCQLCYI